MESYCGNCGEEERLFEAVTGEGVKNLCRRCLRLGNYPIIEKENAEQTRNEHRFFGAKEATPIPNFKKESLKKVSKERDEETVKVDEELEGIVLRKIEIGEYDDLIDNFHWIVRQGRRAKKISAKQFSEQIAEPEVLIVAMERGELPKDYDKLVSKVEQFLGVRIRKNPVRVDGFSGGEFNIRKADLSSVRTGELRVEDKKVEGDVGVSVEGGDDIDIISFEDED
jgi:ribosome-binding protein aMBF1 (putative translation factor)